MHSVVASLLALVIGIGALFTGTDGFNAFTAEKARRYAALNNPEKIKPVMLTTHTGEERAYFDGNDKTVVVEFIFTYCPTLCQSLGRSFYQMQQAVTEKDYGGDVEFVSISFDMDIDTVPRLAAFADRHNADPTLWRIARPTSQDDLDRLLKTFGVVVLEDPLFRYVHNGGLLVVSADGELVSIFNPEDVEGALKFLEARS